MSIDLSGLSLIDTHEHLRPETERAELGGDCFATLFSHYSSTDLLLAGMPKKSLPFIRNTSISIEDRWLKIKPYWDLTKNTAYGLSIRLAIRDLYQVEDLTDTTVSALNEKMQLASKRGLYQQVFEKANIKIAIVQDTDPGILLKPNDSPDLTRQVLRTGELLWIKSKAELDLVTESIEHSPAHSLNEWLNICNLVFERAKAQGVVAIKMPQAYVTSLEVTRPSFSEAEKVFNSLLRKSELFQLGEEISWKEATPLRDYMIHHLVRLAIQYQLPIQIHTGLLESVYNDIRDANPTHLIPLFLEYPEARFILFHGGYPWIYEYAALGKEFPNVWLDLAWLWIISPKAGRELLHLLIETIPQNKHTAFGGDYLFVEGIYGHSLIMRQNVARVLEKKIQEGWFTEDRAMAYAESIFYKNAEQLYSLNGSS